LFYECGAGFPAALWNITGHMTLLADIAALPTGALSASKVPLRDLRLSPWKAQHLERLRHVVAKLERRNASETMPVLSFGIRDLDQRLGGGLACGSLHEMSPKTHRERPAALGFVLALAASALRVRRGHAVFVTSRRALPYGNLYGHGLRELGVDTNRLILIEARNDKDALWALEETLRAQAIPAVVAGAVESNLDLTVSRRLNLAATMHGAPLLLARPAGMVGANAAATRWRITPAPSARDRFGAVARLRWHVSLERCRNGRPGEWLIEWCHVAHRFHLAESVANYASPAREGLRRIG
jgi:protein ImuA